MTPVSHLAPRTIFMTDDSPAPRRHIVRGIALSVVLIPVALAGFGVAVLTILLALFGWAPEQFKDLYFLNPIYSYGGGGFTPERFFIFMGGAMVGTAALTGINWAFTGEKDTTEGLPG